MSDPLHIGIIGCGKISEIYLRNLTGPLSDRVTVVALADMVPEAAGARAEQFGVARHCTPDELLADASIQLVADLTTAPAHAEVNAAILRAGKHLYSEKPLALTMDDGRELLALAEERGLRICVAPDTLLGPAMVAAKRAVDAGQIGDVVAAHASCALGAAGPRYINVFRGPLLDIGPYHVGALLRLLGPAVRLTGQTRPSRKLEASDPGLGPDTPGTAVATIEFAGGALATIMFTADTPGYRADLRLHGTGGFMTLADPNMFGGTVTVRSGPDPRDLPGTAGENRRGLGIADMAAAIAAGRPHTLRGDFSLHTLEVMLAVIESARTDHRVSLTTTFDHK